MPYQGTNGNAQVAGLTKMQGIQEAASHELAQGVTDPFPGYGWYDYTYNAEIGDIVNRQYVKLHGYVVQRISSKDDWPMTPAGATSMYPVSFSLSNGDVYKTTSAGTFLIATGAASISAQSVDNSGQAMIDIVFTSGSAEEYHENGNPGRVGTFITLATSGVKDAQADQGTSWILTKWGTVLQYIDSDWLGGNYTQRIATGVQSMQAGIGTNRVAQVTMTLTTGKTQIYNDSYSGKKKSGGGGGDGGAGSMVRPPVAEAITPQGLVARAVLADPFAGAMRGMGPVIYLPWDSDAGHRLPCAPGSHGRGGRPGSRGHGVPVARSIAVGRPVAAAAGHRARRRFRFAGRPGARRDPGCGVTCPVRPDCRLSLRERMNSRGARGDYRRHYWLNTNSFVFSSAQMMSS
jgi:hypothetical protein